MYGEVFEFLELGESVPFAQCTEVVAARKRLEDAFCRAGIDQDDPVSSTEADVQLHPRVRDLVQHGVVAAQQFVRIAGESRSMRASAPRPVRADVWPREPEPCKGFVGGRRLFS